MLTQVMSTANGSKGHQKIEENSQEIRIFMSKKKCCTDMSVVCQLENTNTLFRYRFPKIFLAPIFLLIMMPKFSIGSLHTLQISMIAKKDITIIHL